VEGNIDAVRLEYAPENVKGMWRMLQIDTPEDFVLATGTGNRAREFLASPSIRSASTGSNTFDSTNVMCVAPRLMR
jgi:GDP-D-mannose dehydratase